MVLVLVLLRPHLCWVRARYKKCHPKQTSFLLLKALRKLIPSNGIRVIWPVCGISSMSASTRFLSDQCLRLPILIYHASSARILFSGPSARLGIPRHLLCPSDTISDDSSLRDMTPHLSCLHFSATSGSRACSASGNRSEWINCLPPKAVGGLRPRRRTTCFPTNILDFYDTCVTPQKKKFDQRRQDGVNGWLWKIGWLGHAVHGNREEGIGVRDIYGRCNETDDISLSLVFGAFVLLSILGISTIIEKIIINHIFESFNVHDITHGKQFISFVFGHSILPTWYSWLAAQRGTPALAQLVDK